jgi:hypothetical protein
LPGTRHEVPGWGARPGHHCVRSAGSPPSGASAKGEEAPTLAERSGRQLGATLAPAGGQDRAAGPGPHPVAETVGTAATPKAGLERALGHGRAPTIVKVGQVRRCGAGPRSPPRRRSAKAPAKRRPSNGTGHRQGGQTARGCELCRGGLVPSSRHAARPATFRDWVARRVPTLLASRFALPSTSRGLFGSARTGLLVHGRRSPPALADRRHICAQLWITMWRMGPQDARLTHDNPPRGWAAAEPDSLPRAGRRHRICMENE